MLGDLISSYYNKKENAIKTIVFIAFSFLLYYFYMHYIYLN
jgi:uncharacterized membrane protein